MFFLIIENGHYEKKLVSLDGKNIEEAKNEAINYLQYMGYNPTYILKVSLVETVGDLTGQVSAAYKKHILNEKLNEIKLKESTIEKYKKEIEKLEKELLNGRK